MTKNARSATYSGHPAPRMITEPRNQPPSAPETFTLRAKYPASARAAFTTSQAAVCGQSANGSVAWMPAMTSVTAEAAGTAMLSSIPSGSDSTMAAASAVTATSRGACHPSHHATAIPAAVPATRKESSPPQLFSRFHGSRAIGMACPPSVAKPSPAAIISHATAA